MKYKTAYPKTYIKTADVILSRGALPVGCQILNGGINSELTVKETLNHSFSDITLAQYSAASDCYYICADGKVYVSQQGLKFAETGNLPAQSPFMFEQRENGVKQTVIVGDDRYIVFTGLTFTVKLFELKSITAS